MASRLRYVVKDMQERYQSGARALRIIRSLRSAQSWPKVNWKAIDIEGRRDRMFIHLYVWREKRRLPKRESPYSKMLNHRFNHPPLERARRTVAQATPSTPRRTPGTIFTWRDVANGAIPGSGRDTPRLSDPRPANPPRLGVFA